MEKTLFTKTFVVAKTRGDNKADLISQIVDRTRGTPEAKKALARRLAIAGNTMGWTVTDLHALLKKADDPAIRNFTAFVTWSAKVTRK